LAKLTIAFGVLLILIGVAGYIATGSSHTTALIPAFLGLPILILGVLALNENRRKHAMHGAVALALICCLGSARGLAQLPALLSGGAVARPAAVIEQAVTAVLCALFIVACVRSFVAARRGAA